MHLRTQHQSSSSCGLSFDDVMDVFDKTSLREHVLRSLQYIDKALDEHAIDSMAFSFNGGKDSTVLLHLLYWGIQLHATHQIPKIGDISAVSRSTAPCTDDGDDGRHELLRRVGVPSPSDASDSFGGLRIIYFEHNDDFSEVKQFVHESAKRYNTTIRCIPMSLRAGLFHVHAEKPLSAVFLGVRRTDSYNRIQSPCDPGWPQFVRLNVILDWTFSEIWQFIDMLHLPYVHLYDEGYTSLGLVTNTERNPHLLCNAIYLPARKLSNPEYERGGRQSNAR